MRAGLYGISSTYTLSGGLLESGNAYLQSGPGRARFVQLGGTHSSTQSLTLEGATWHGTSPRPATYYLGNGKLTAASLVVGFGELIQSNGLASISGVLELGGDTYSRWGSILAGGTLACSELQSSGGGANFQQTGGSLIVTNLFSFGGQPTCCSPTSAPFYSLGDATLTASNISIGTFRNGTNLNTRFKIASSALSGRITNPGYFRLSGILISEDANEQQLGRFILGGASTIDLGSGNAKLRFAASGGEAWNASSILTVANWAGSPNGGGNDQLKFGGNASGLSAAQLQKIIFVNPAGFAPGNYYAQILSTGEVLPRASASVSMTHSPSSLVLNWPAGWTLQSATNVTGPYMDVSGATSPYTNQFGTSRRFFRLRQ